jgi:two-component system, LuxR family, sensor kinase FixL
MIGFQPKRHRSTDRSNDMQVADALLGVFGARLLLRGDERIEVAALVDSVHAHVHDRMARAGIEWRTEIEAGVRALRADAVQLAAVLTNLLGNACEALAGLNGARAICVRVRRVAANPAAPGTPAMVRITVEDSGPGVPAEVRERLFTPLATSKPHGMRLGLALSRSIAERQGGRLWFDSTAEKTTFCLDVPRY